MAAARVLIGNARGEVYVSAPPRYLDDLAGDLRDAGGRGVDVSIVPFESVDRLALAADSREVLTAVTGGEAWEAVRSSNPAVVAAIESLIRLKDVARHDASL